MSKIRQRAGAAVAVAAAAAVKGGAAVADATDADVSATPAVDGKVIVGTQGPIFVPGGGPGGEMLAFDKNTGALLWATQLDAHPAAIVTQSATVHDRRVCVGVASQEEALAAFVPGYPCCSFRGSMLALDVDTRRAQVCMATGNNYSVPDTVLQCVANAGSDPAVIQACIASDDLFDAIVALDLATGAVRWPTKALPYDAWTVGCFPPPFGNGSNCPDPEGRDYDFGQAPALYTSRVNGKSAQLVGAGQKSGQYGSLDPDTGAVAGVTQAGPGGTGGGLRWGSAVDGQRVYTANSNSNSAPASRTTSCTRSSCPRRKSD